MPKDVFVARQPIVDSTERLWGYELLFRDGIQNNVATFSSPDKATIDVSSCGYLLSSSDTPQYCKIFINFTGELLIERIPLALPASSTVIELLEDVAITDQVISALIDLKNEGYTIALDDFTGDDSYRTIWDYVDIVKCDCIGKSIDELIQLRQKFHNIPCMFLAEKVDSESMFFALRDNGYDLFQGYYFAKPEILKGKKISSLDISKLNLASIIENEELDIDNILNTIKSDVSLSYRLLLYVNSSAFSFRSKITSLKQALTLLGFKKIRHWLRLIIYPDLMAKQSNTELLRLALQRSYFFDNLGCKENHNDLPYDSLFIVGILSFLEAILNTPIETILNTLPLHSIINNTLLGNKTSLSEYIDLAVAIEVGDFVNIERICKTLEISDGHAFVSYQEACKTADDLINEL